MSGLIHIYTGNGKGKTTAATGLALRFAGSGGRVLYTQLLKRNDSSELKLLEQIDNIELMRCERCFGFISGMTREVRKEAEQFYTEYIENVCQQVCTYPDRYGMLVMDELVTAYGAQLVDRELVLEFLRNRPKELELVLTGRNAAMELLELADYVSEIQKRKHPFDKGIKARKGIEL